MIFFKTSDSTRIGINTFKTKEGELQINIRKFYKTKNSEDWLPTKQGLTLSLEKARKLKKALSAAFEEPEKFLVELEGKSKKKAKED